MPNGTFLVLEQRDDPTASPMNACEHARPDPVLQSS